MKQTALAAIVLSSCLPALVLAEAPSETRIAINLVTHNSVVIDRPAATVWPFIANDTSWKKGPQLRHLSGPRGEVGEVFEAIMSDAPKPVFDAQNVVVVKDKRRTMKLYNTDNGPLIGYATWQLHEVRGTTRVTYDVLAEITLSPEEAKGMTAQALERKQAHYTAENSKRLQAEFSDLKNLLERRPVTGQDAR